MTSSVVTAFLDDEEDATLKPLLPQNTVEIRPDSDDDAGPCERLIAILAQLFNNGDKTSSFMMKRFFGVQRPIN